MVAACLARNFAAACWPLAYIFRASSWLRPKSTGDVPNVFTQLEAALCLLARAKGENPQKQYFYNSTPNVAKLQLDGGTYQIVLTQEEPSDPEGQGRTGG